MSKKTPVKNAAIFFTITLAIFLLSVFVIKPLRDKMLTNKEKAKLIFPDIKREDVTNFKVVNGDNVILFEKIESRWTTTIANLSAGKKERFNADPETVDGMLSIILSAQEDIFNGSSSEPAFGLTTPASKLYFPTADTKKVLNIGTDSAVGYKAYAHWEGDSRVFLTNRSLKINLNKSLNDLRNKNVIDFNSLSISTLNISNLREDSPKSFNKNKLRLSQKENGYWYFKNLNKIPADSKKIVKYLKELKETRVSDFYNKKDNPDLFRAFNNPSGILSFSDSNGGNTWRYLKKADKHLLKKDGSTEFYAVSAAFSDYFKKSTIDFRKTNILSSDSNLITKIELRHADASFVFHRSAPEKNWSSPSHPKLKLKQLSIENLLVALNQLEATEFLASQEQKMITDAPDRILKLSFPKAEEITIFMKNDPRKARFLIFQAELGSPVVAKFDMLQYLSMDDEHWFDIKKQKASSKPSEPATKKRSGRVKLETTTEGVSKLESANLDSSKNYEAVMTVKGKGQLTIKFEYNKAPYTVSNFVNLARNNFYNGVSFHRVIPDFVIQGGDPQGTGAGGPGYKFHDEDNDLTHVKGALSMANAGPNTNGSQFFIVKAPQPHLNGKHTVFGHVTDGHELIDTIVQGDVMENVEVFEISQ